MTANPCKLTRPVRHENRSRTWKNAQVLRLVKAIRDMFDSEVKVSTSSCTWTQDPALRLIVKDQADNVEAMLLAEDKV